MMLKAKLGLSIFILACSFLKGMESKEECSWEEKKLRGSREGRALLGFIETKITAKHPYQMTPKFIAREMKVFRSIVNDWRIVKDIRRNIDISKQDRIISVWLIKEIIAKDRFYINPLQCQMFTVVRELYTRVADSQFPAPTPLIGDKFFDCIEYSCVYPCLSRALLLYNNPDFLRRQMRISGEFISNKINIISQEYDVLKARIRLLNETLSDLNNTTYNTRVVRKEKIKVRKKIARCEREAALKKEVLANLDRLMEYKDRNSA